MGPPEAKGLCQLDTRELYFTPLTGDGLDQLEDIIPVRKGPIELAERRLYFRVLQID